MTVKLPIDPNTTRKDYPLYSGLLSYFPNALAYVSYVSKKANDQHNPGEPLHWARGKSTDHLDCAVRHMLNAGQRDEDGLLETAKAAWRLLAQLEIELEGLRGAVETPTALAANLYDWSLAPEWAMWAATFDDGSFGWWEKEPNWDKTRRRWDYDVYHRRGDRYEPAEAGGFAGHPFRGPESLEARPSKAVQSPRVALA